MPSQIIQTLEANVNKPVYFNASKDRLTFQKEPNSSRNCCSITLQKSKGFLGKVKTKYLLTKIDAKVFVNDGEIKRAATITDGDAIELEDIRFSLNGRVTDQFIAPAVTCDKLSLKRSGKTVLSNVSFQLERGDFLVILGPSGCGKTSLLKELAGENNRSSGDIYFGNQPFYQYFHREIKRNIGYVEQFDEKNLYQSLSVKTFLEYTAKIKGVVSPEKAVEKLIQLLGLGKFQNQAISTLSGGQQKKVAIGKEILHSPDILLLDEPTSPLDPHSVKNLLTVLKGYTDTNKTIIMVSHKPDDLEAATKILFLARGGRTAFFGSKADFNNYLKKNQKGIEALYNQYDENNVAAEYIVNLGNYKKGEIRTKTRIKANAFLQLYHLTIRYFHLKLSRKYLYSQVIQAAGIGALFFAFPFFNVTCLFLLSLAVIWFGVSNAVKEIVEEIPIYSRERSFSLNLDAYLSSKLLVLLTISTIQIVILISAIMIVFPNKGVGSIYLFDPVRTGGFLLLLAASATALGLFISCTRSKIEQVLVIAPLVLMAQIVFSGLVSKPDRLFKENLSYFTLGRWGLEGLSRIQDDKAKSIIQYETGRFKKLEMEKDTTVEITKRKSLVLDHLPETAFDTLSSDTAAAISLLGSYDKRLRRDNREPWEFFNSFDKNISMIIALGLISYFFARTLILKRDRIPISAFNNRHGITIRIVFVIIAIEILFSMRIQQMKKVVDHTEIDHGKEVKKELERKKKLLDWYRKNGRYPDTLRKKLSP